MPLAIFVRPDGNNELVTFGHEVGHIFMGLVARSNYGQHNRELEAFCELFGREMALPSCELRSITVANESVIMDLLETYGTDLDTTLTQLVELGKLPRKLLVLTRVPLEYGGMHAGRVVEVVFCFDCNEHEYQLCTPGQKEKLARFDLSTREDAYNLTACGNEKRWVYEEERTDRLIGESFWDDSDESFQERDIL